MLLLTFYVPFLFVSKNVTVDNSPYKMTAEEATGIVNHVSRLALFITRSQF